MLKLSRTLLAIAFLMLAGFLLLAFLAGIHALPMR